MTQATTRKCSLGLLIFRREPIKQGLRESCQIEGVEKSSESSIPFGFLLVKQSEFERHRFSQVCSGCPAGNHLRLLLRFPLLRCRLSGPNTPRRRRRVLRLVSARITKSGSRTPEDPDDEHRLQKTGAFCHRMCFLSLGPAESKA